MSTTEVIHDPATAFAPTPLVARNDTERELLIGLHVDPERFRSPYELYGHKSLTRHVHDTLSRWVRHGIVHAEQVGTTSWVHYRIAPEFLDPVLIRQQMIKRGDDLRRAHRRAEERSIRAGEELAGHLAEVRACERAADRTERGLLRRALRNAQTAISAFDAIEREEDFLADRHRDLQSWAQAWGFDPDAVWAGAMSDDTADPIGGDA